MDVFRIALAQLEPILFDKAANLKKAEATIQRASARGAQAILFPELYLTGYNLGQRAAEMAEPLNGPSIQWIAQLAEKYQIAVLMGFAELDPVSGKVFDSVVVCAADGQVIGAYRKVHLYQAEKHSFHPGIEPCVLDFGLGPAGLLVCYDLEFPEAARALILRGAQWVAVSTGNMVPNQHTQEIYIQSRAAENRCWVALANRTGQEGSLSFFGGSAVADPFGHLVAQAGEQEELVVVDVDLSLASQARLNADYLADRKPALYQAWETG